MPSCRFADLREYLGSLPPPRPGTRRYFRGQSSHYPSMKPTGVRSAEKHPKWALWAFYSHFLAAHIWKPVSDRSSASEAGKAARTWLPGLDMGATDTEAMEAVDEVWSYAILQHYGPGSSFLDITRSLEVALWFALRPLESVEVQIPTWVTFSGTTWLRCAGHAETGYLYVFDLEPWVPGTPVRHGLVVDLEDAPPFFHSNRMRVQEACLVFADPEVDEGDLQSFLVADAHCPIAVQWPMEGTEGLERNVEDIFPGPDADVWYDRFLSIPLVASTEESDSTAPFEYPFSLNLYFPSDDRLLAPITVRNSIVAPYLLYPKIPLEFDLTTIRKLLPDWSEERLRSVVPILLEGPLMAATAPLPLWNPRLLIEDQAWETEVFTIDTYQMLGSASLENIFVEFSPLEASGWEERVPKELYRALWLIRDGTRYIITEFCQTWCNAANGQDGETPIMQIGPTASEFSEEENRFVRADDYYGPKGIKAFYCILEFLRFLSPELKAAAFPATILSSADRKPAYLGGAYRQLLRLVKPKSLVLRNHLMPRIAGSDFPFVGGLSRFEKSYAGYGTFFMQDYPEASWAEMAPSRIQSVLSKQEEIPTPLKTPFGTHWAASPFGEGGLMRQNMGAIFRYVDRRKARDGIAVETAAEFQRVVEEGFMAREQSE
jgi:hypothetical protein